MISKKIKASLVTTLILSYTGLKEIRPFAISYFLVDEPDEKILIDLLSIRPDPIKYLKPNLSYTIDAEFEIENHRTGEEELVLRHFVIDGRKFSRIR